MSLEQQVAAVLRACGRLGIKKTFREEINAKSKTATLQSADRESSRP
jgi:hypothetical protein